MKIYKIVLDELKRLMPEGMTSEKLVLDFPPNIELGDFSVNCFLHAKDTGKKPIDIAADLAEAFKKSDMFKKTDVAGPYVNISVKSDILFGNLEILDDVEASKSKVMVEYLQPNTNKPLHLGHARNGCLGMSLSNILKANGNDVINANLINDRGVHICKSMLAWMRWGNGETPEISGMKGDHLVGKYYVIYNQKVKDEPELEKEVQKMLIKWEQRDPEIWDVWKKMNGWVIKGFDETNENFGFIFDKVYYESETYKLGKEIVLDGLKRGIFEKDEYGNIVYNLPPEKFGTEKDGSKKRVTMLRSDGTSLYITQDLGTAKLKYDEYKLDRSIHVVGNEQNYHFQVLFNVLEALGFEWAKNWYHLSYGMVTLPSGKMKSREGTVVDADDLLKEIEELAKAEIKKRTNDISDTELSQRANKVGLGAIKFFLLKTAPKNNICFNPEESISFDGMTGPYCQYAYARATQILDKVGKVGAETDFSQLGNVEERLIAQKLNNLDMQIKKAGEDLNPSRVAVAIYELAVSFNQFYQKHSVRNTESEDLKISRARLVELVRNGLKEGLNLLGIEAIDKM